MKIDYNIYISQLLELPESILGTNIATEEEYNYLTIAYGNLNLKQCFLLLKNKIWHIEYYVLRHLLYLTLKLSFLCLFVGLSSCFLFRVTVPPFLCGKSLFTYSKTIRDYNWIWEFLSLESCIPMPLSMGPVSNLCRNVPKILSLHFYLT